MKIKENGKVRVRIHVQAKLVSKNPRDGRAPFFNLTLRNPAISIRHVNFPVVVGTHFDLQDVTTGIKVRRAELFFLPSFILTFFDESGRGLI